MKNKSVIAWVLVVLYGAAIFLLSAISGLSPIFKVPEKYIWDKLLHLLEYLVLGMLLARALYFSFKYRSLGHLVFMVFVFGSLYGASDEWHQHFVSYRTCDYRDWIADSLGVFIGAYVWGIPSFTISKKEISA